MSGPVPLEDLYSLMKVLHHPDAMHTPKSPVGTYLGQGNLVAPVMITAVRVFAIEQK